MTRPPSDPPSSASTAGRATEGDQLATLFDLGRQVTSVLELDELLHRIPELIARLISFDAFAVYLLDERRQELRIAYPVGYPEGAAEHVRLRVGEGVVGTAVAEARPLVVSDLTREPRYKRFVPGMRSAIVVPLTYQNRVIGALNILSRSIGQFTEADLAIVRQFGVHVAVAIENARLFEDARRMARVFETLAEIGHEVASILELDELLRRIAQLVKRVIDYRTFGIMLLDEETGYLEMKVAVQYGEHPSPPRVKLGEGLVGHAALHGEPVLVPDVSRDSRYIKVLEDVRSELAVPMIYKGRTIGVFDLESPELDAFDQRHVDTLTVLASQAAVAIENARLYEAVRANEDRLDREVRFAQRVQAALLPTSLPRRLRGLDVAARFEPARELGGDFYDLLSPESNTLVVAVGDVSGKGVPAALYSAFAGELVRSRTFRRRLVPERATPAKVLSSVNTILHQRQLEEYYCTLCYAAVDLKRRVMTLANSGLPYPIRFDRAGGRRIELPGVPLGSFAGSSYDELSFPLDRGSVFVFCTDGIYEAMNASGEEFGHARVIDIVERTHDASARAIVDDIFEAVQRFAGPAQRHDDMTVVALKVTA